MIEMLIFGLGCALAGWFCGYVIGLTQITNKLEKDSKDSDSYVEKK